MQAGRRLKSARTLLRCPGAFRVHAVGIRRLSRGAFQNGQRRAGPQTARAGLHHVYGLLPAVHAAGGLALQGIGDGGLHQPDVRHGCAAGTKAGAGFDVVGARIDASLAGEHLLLIGQVAAFNNDLYQRVGSSFHDTANIAFQQGQIAAFQRADVDDHIHFVRAIGDGVPGFEGLDGGGVGSQRKADDRAYIYAAALEQLCRQRYMAGVDAYAGGVKGFGRFTQLGDLLGGWRRP